MPIGPQTRIAQTKKLRPTSRKPLTLGELLAAYIEAESQPYDREIGGEQPGTKRSAESDAASVKNITKHLSANLSAARVNREALLELADQRERENPTPARATRRKTFAFLRRVFSWGAARPGRTGINRSPFDDLKREDRNRLFPMVKLRSYIYSPEELRAIYEKLPAYEVPFVRFAIYTAMRLREITTLTWENVDLERCVAHVEARFAKNGKERDVALGEAAVSILTAIQPTQPTATDHVFIGRRGRPIRDVRGGFDSAVLEVWKPAKPDELKPRFHDLRKTGATRVEAVSSHAVAKKFLGHSDVDVTDSYIVPSLDEVRRAINRAARSIDGETPAGAIPFPANPSHQPSHLADQDADMVRRRS